MPEIRIGVSGWSYPTWRGGFYPAGLPTGAELEFLAAKMNSVEINASFYALKTPARYEQWGAQTPDGFVFAVKGSRYLTQQKKLHDVRTPLANFFASGPVALGDRLGTFLWQLPAALHFDPVRIRAFFELLPVTATQALALAGAHDPRVVASPWTGPVTAAPIRHAVEVRHASYACPRFFELADQHGIAIVVSDSAGTWPVIEHVGAGFAYLRLHGPDELYRGSYSPVQLAGWAARIADWARERDVFVFFDNDSDGYAPFNALDLSGLFTR